MHISTTLYTLFFGKLVGSDEFGNRYYKNRKCFENTKTRRWVVYKGLAEPSKVPPKWHGWLHYTFDAPLEDRNYDWQENFVPNLTGTKLAYNPPGKIGKRAKATGDYEAWKP